MPIRNIETSIGVRDEKTKTGMHPLEDEDGEPEDWIVVSEEEGRRVVRTMSDEEGADLGWGLNTRHK